MKFNELVDQAETVDMMNVNKPETRIPIQLNTSYHNLGLGMITSWQVRNGISAFKN